MTWQMERHASSSLGRLILVLIGALLLALPARADTAPVITSAPSSQTVNLGVGATFSVTATGTAPLAYQWYKNGTAISGATAASYAIASVQASDAATYTVAVTNGAGTARTYAPFGTAFALGGYHSLFTKSDGTLWGCGNNSYGQLGDGTFVTHYAPAQLATGVTAVATGSNHSLILKSDGSVWATGYNGNGALGDSTTTNRNTFTQVATGVTAIAAGTYHSLFLKSNGSLWGMGANGSGQLGDGTAVDRATPVQIATGVTKIAAGDAQTLFIKTDGSLWGTGNNYYGQLGDGSYSNHYAPYQIASGVSSVTAGYSHTLYLKTDGTLWGMGLNNYGQLGTGSSYYYQITPIQLAVNVTDVAAGGYHSLYLKGDSSLWAFGYNYSGQLGDGTLYYYSRTTPSQMMTGVSAMKGGPYQSALLKADGTLWTVGMNNNGQLGDGTQANRSTPVPVYCTGDSLAILTVVLPPVITTQPVSQNVTAGNLVAVSVAASGTSPFTYQWMKDDVSIPGANGPMYVIQPFTINQTGKYSVAVTNSAGTATSTAATLSLNVPLVSAQNGVTGKSASFLASTGGSGDIAWQVSTDGGSTWTNLTEGSTYVGTTSTLLDIVSVTPAMNGYLYRYTVTGNGQTVSSNGAKLNAFTSPLTMPMGIVGDKSGNLYVSDAAAQTVVKVGTDLKLSLVAGKNGTMGLLDGTGAAAQFNEPSGLIHLDDDTIVLADTSNNVVRNISAQGAVTTLAGSHDAGSVDADGAAARFNAPVGVSADLAGVYLIADQSNHTIRQVTGAGRVLTLAGKPGVPGTADGKGSSASFNQPTGIITRRDQYNYFSWNGGSNGYGTVFVSDQGSHTIRTVQPSGQVDTYVGKPSQPGSADGSRDVARFNKPGGLTMDGDGNLYVADTGNHTIRKIDTLGYVSTLAGLAGVSGLMDGTGKQALFNAPEGLTYGSDRNFYVTDTGNGVIRKVTPAGVVTTLSILGNVPAIGTQPTSQSVTTGSSVTFSVAATGEGTLSYQWKKDGTIISGATSASYSISSTATSDAGNYSVTVTNSWGSTASNAASLTVSAPPPPTPVRTGGGSGGGGGGGAPSPLFLAAIALAAITRGRLLRQQSAGRD